MPQKTMTGPRAQVMMVDPANPANTRVVGIFTSCSWGLAYGAEPLHILGRYSPDEIVYTSQEAVTIRCSGWRVVDAGPHAVGSMPTLSQLLNHEYIEMAVYDRQTGKRIAAFHSVRPVSYDTNVANRAPEEVTITFMGLLVDDETATNAETAGASTLP